MLKLIRFVFTGSWHEHEWETLNSINIFKTDSYGKIYGDITARGYTLKCKSCGNLKYEKFYI